MKKKNTITMNNQNEMPNEGNSITLEVPRMLFEDLRNGILKHIDIPIHLDSYSAVLENIDGNLILNCDEMPESFYACYFLTAKIARRCATSELRRISVSIDLFALTLER